MSSDIVIKVEKVSKKFSRRLRYVMLYGMQDILRNLLGLSSNPSKLRKGEFWALKDVSFEVKKGETIGIIGANGSGKTTLLKLLNGIFMPDTGRIEIKGKVGALIELGAGFHPLLTGRENIYINGTILGMSKKEINKKFDEIIDFADIGDFIDTPVKHYSSGMYVRLGFAIAIHSDPDILLIDEVLAVGDVQFQVKCFRKITSLKEMGKTIIIVTHDMGIIQKYTDRVILLDKGHLHCIDTPKDAINKYLSLVSSKFEEIQDKTKSVPIELGISTKKLPNQNIEYDFSPKRKNYNKNEFRYGNGKARIIDFILCDTNGKEITSVMSKDKVIFKVKVKFYEDVEKPIFGVIVKTKDGIELYGSNTLQKEIDVKPQKKGNELWIEYHLNFNLQPGDYFLSAGVAEMKSFDIIPLDRRYDIAYISVVSTQKSSGIVEMDGDIKIYPEE
jgi:ABC-type polysaccharide/polyol phosphate transport system ATPase subunit